MPKLIVITGTPGVGKSGVARRIAQRVEANLIDLTPLVKTEKLASGYDSFRGSLIIDEIRVRKRLAKEMASGRNLVVATHSIGRILPWDVNTRAIVLRLNPVTLYRRLMKRGWRRYKVWENVESELLDVCYFDATSVLGLERVFEIDASNLSNRALVEKALSILNRKRVRPVRVNWLSKYDPIDLARRLNWRSTS